MNKKAQGMSITTIILIILGIVVLVVLILGFTMGWSIFKDWIGGSNNVGQIISKCRVACASQSEYGYCYEKRKVVLDRDMEFSNTCAALFQIFKDKLGVENCESLECDGLSDELTCEEVFSGVLVSREKCGSVGVGRGYAGIMFGNPQTGPICCVDMERVILDKFNVVYQP